MLWNEMEWKAIPTEKLTGKRTVLEMLVDLELEEVLLLLLLLVWVFSNEDEELNEAAEEATTEELAVDADVEVKEDAGAFVTGIA